MSDDCRLTLEGARVFLRAAKAAGYEAHSRLKSTAGWNIDNVLLDFMGGLLSLLQLLLDAGCSGQWSQLVGDPVKFGLGFSSMFFDTLFMVQHFVLYRGAKTVAIPMAGMDSMGDAHCGLVEDVNCTE